MPSTVPHGAKRQDGMGFPPEGLHLLKLGDNLSRARSIPADSTVDQILDDEKIVAELGLLDLAKSIAQYGQIQPGAVREDSEGSGVIVAGGRRFLAVCLINRDPASFTGRDGKPLKGPLPYKATKIFCNDEEALELNLVENLQRKEMDVVDRAHAARDAVSVYEWTQERVAAVMGCSASSVVALLRIARLPSSTQSLIKRGKLTAAGANGLIGLSEREVKKITEEIEGGRVAREVFGEIKAKKRASGEAIGRSMAELRAALKESGQWGATQLLRWLSGELDDLADCFDVTACVGSKEKVVIAGREVEVHDAG